MVKELVKHEPDIYLHLTNYIFDITENKDDSLWSKGRGGVSAGTGNLTDNQHLSGHLSASLFLV